MDEQHVIEAEFERRPVVKAEQFACAPRDGQVDDLKPRLRYHGEIADTDSKGADVHGLR